MWKYNWHQLSSGQEEIIDAETIDIEFVKEPENNYPTEGAWQDMLSGVISIPRRRGSSTNNSDPTKKWFILATVIGIIVICVLQTPH